MVCRITFEGLSAGRRVGIGNEIPERRGYRVEGIGK